jgi:hypothetical protein
MHDSNEIIENDHSGDGNFVIIIDDDDDDANPLVTIVGPHGALAPAPDAVVALPMVPVATHALPEPQAPVESMNIGGAPLAESIAALTIPPLSASVEVVTITRAPLAMAVSVATQTTCTWSPDEGEQRH